MKTPLLLLTLFAGFNVVGQDEIKTDNGNLVIYPVLHGSLALTWGSKTIYVDPYGGADAFSEFNSPEIILITDIHGDHLHKETLNAIETSNSTFVVPQAVADQLPEGMATKIVIMKNGDKQRIENISVEAIPMYNLPETTDSRHPKGRGNGYVLTMGGKRVYISGDTEDIKEMRALKNIDVAFVCMNLPYTMDINQAASAVIEFKPAIVYPFHYRGQGGLADVSTFKKLVEEKDKSIEVRLRNWYP